MARTVDSEAIVKHALKNERNLRMAIKVGLAYQTLKDKIVREFALALKTAVQKDLGSPWSVGTCVDPANNVDERCFVLAWKPSWRNCSVGLYGEKGLTKLMLRLCGKSRVGQDAGR